VKTAAPARSWCLAGTCAAIAACALPGRADSVPTGAEPEATVQAPGADAQSASLDSDATPTHRAPTPNAVSALALQREGATDLAAVPRDVPLTAPLAAPHWSTSAELAGHAYRLSLSRGPLDLGMSFDTATRAARPPDARIDSQGPVMATLPSLSLGLRQGSEATASSLLERAGGGSHDYLSKVGIQWKPAESQVSFLREGLGMRLDSNERITMRLRKGLFSVYLQRRF